MYIKDLSTGEVMKYGTDCHDSLRISEDGTHLTYEHLQNGDGSEPYGGYRFVTDKKALKEQMSQHDKEIFIEGWKAGFRACEDLNEDGL